MLNAKQTKTISFFAKSNQRRIERKITDKIVARIIKYSWIASESMIEIRRRTRRKTMILFIFKQVYNVIVQ